MISASSSQRHPEPVEETLARDGANLLRQRAIGETGALLRDQGRDRYFLTHPLLRRAFDGGSHESGRSGQ
jgi:hypothetical protein